MQKATLLLTTAVIATTTVALFPFSGFADGKDSHKKSNQTRAIVGPDVVCWYTGGSSGLDMENYGSGDGILSFAFGTTSCNWGDEEADWGLNGSTSYPVIAQNCYRLVDGRFEQIGTAWLKHSFCAVSEPGCGSCQSTPCSTLGIGCADTYWAGLNADATAPRSAINAYTGQYDFPFNIAPTGDSWRRGRLLLAEADISSSSNPGAMYFIEGQYIATDEAPYSNQWNNCSWRQVDFSSMTNPTALNQTQVAEPAIFAWKEYDNEVDLQMVQVPDDGQLHIAARAYDNGNGTWDYEYAVHNMNSHRSVGSFSINVGSATVTNVGFHDADYHSGEIIDTTDWNWTHNGNTLMWNTDDYHTNEWANAIRWGSVYNFRFTADVAPDTTDIGLGLFRAGSPSELSVMTVGPTGTPPSLIIGYPDGQPELFDPNGGTTVDITIASAASEPVSGSAMLHWSADGSSDDVALVELGNDMYQAVFPSFECGAIVNWYISVDSSDGNSMNSPPSAPDSTWSGIALSGYEVSYEDDFEDELGWTVSGDATDGQWDRGVPVGGGDRCDPSTDGDGSGSCYLTDNTDDNSDVDGGSTILTSPAMDTSNSTTLSYMRWYSNGANCSGANSQADIMEVDFSVDDGQTWSNLEIVGPSGSDVSGGWFTKEFELTTIDGFIPTNQFRLRFTVSDLDGGSVVEAGIDGMLLSGGICDTTSCNSDVTGDGLVNVSDVLALIGVWGPCSGCGEDIDGSGIVDVVDLLEVIGSWGPCQ